MNSIPCEIYREIYSYLKPIGNKNMLRYKRSIIWCNKCGEKLIKVGWFLFMNSHSIIIAYKCNLCSFENIYTEKDEGWAELVDHAVNYKNDNENSYFSK